MQNTVYCDKSVNDYEEYSPERMHEFAEVLTELRQFSRNHKKLRNGIAKAIYQGRTTGEKKINLSRLKGLYKNIKEGKKLVYKINDFCSLMREEIKELSIPDYKKVKLETRLDGLKSEATKFGVLLNRSYNTKGLDNCRVIAKNKKLKVLILSVGALNGVRIGLNWRIKTANNAILTVVGVKNYISAAVVTKGNWKNIRPGMKAEFNNSKN